MSERFIPRAGAVFSADIAVPQHERVRRFYSRVLSTGDTPLWRDDLLSSAGVPIIGVGERTAETDHLPLQWMPHVQVTDVAAAVSAARGLGGDVLMHAQGPDGSSTFAVLQDPAGAAFGIIPVIPDAALADVTFPDDGRFGRIAWLDLTVTDAPKIRDFYREVLGWIPDDVPMKDGESSYADYTMQPADASPVAGVCHARGVNRELPPVWMLYLPVGDIDESLRRVEAEGGSIIKATRRKDGGYSYAAVMDPLGAAFALVPA